MNLVKNDKKTINAWCVYDWANSVYSLTITTAVFPSYFYEVTGGKEAIISFLGMDVKNTVLYTYILSVSFLLVALMNPILSALADSTGSKKKFMQFFCYLGSLSCISLFFFDSSTITLGGFAFGFAAIGFAGSLVFYNSFLPEIATADRFDKVSARGFSLGYIGSVILLIFNLLMILKPELFGIPLGDDGKAIDGTLAPRISFLTVGIWWAGFAQYTFKYLPENIYNKETKGNIFKIGLNELKNVWGQVRESVNLKRFLIAFALFSLGVQTVMYLATIFGEEVIGMQMDELIALVLVIQLVAIPGSYFFAWLSDKKGNIFSLSTSLIVWIFVCLSAYLMSEGMNIEYYMIGFVVGVVMGGVQSLSRSTYSKLIPKDTQNHASFFSFFETIEKIAIAIGTFIFGLVLQFTGSMNYSALMLTIFFILGIIVLLKVKVNKE